MIGSTGAAALATTAAVAYQWHNSKDSVRVHCANTEYNEMICDYLSDLLGNRRTPLWVPAFGGNVQTLYACRLRPVPELAFERELLTLDDGGTIAVDTIDVEEGEKGKRERKRSRQIRVFIVPGYGNGSDVGYVRILARACLQRGWSVSVFIPRGCGGVKLTTARFFWPGDTRDLDAAIRHVALKYPGERMVGVGFSLGGNKLLSLLGGRSGPATPLRAAITVSQPYDALQTLEYFRTHRRYSRYFCEKMKTLLREHREIFDADTRVGVELVDRLLSPQTEYIEQFDEQLSVPLSGHKSVEEYYECNSSVNRMNGVAIPLLLINARDDPLVPPHLIPYEKIKANDNMILLETRLGTHLGFSQGGLIIPREENWADCVVLRFIEAVVDGRHQKCLSTGKNE